MIEHTCCEKKSDGFLFGCLWLCAVLYSIKVTRVCQTHIRNTSDDELIVGRVSPKSFLNPRNISLGSTNDRDEAIGRVKDRERERE